MISKVFAVFDSKVSAFAQPFFMHAKGEAIRGFIELANDPSTKICKYPEDFTLFELGEYDHSSGRLTSLPTPESLGVAISFKGSK